MSYKQYNTRNSTGRYNNPGQFVSAGELQPARANGPPARAPGPLAPAPQQPPIQQSQQVSPMQVDQKPNSQNQAPVQVPTAELKVEAPDTPAGDDTSRPSWMKSKLAGVRKLSNKERRRRQNETLRKLLTPKNALMVLNEMMSNEPVANQCKVEPSAQFAAGQFYSRQQSQYSFCADLTLAGTSYKGYGESKITARNAAAEQAIRDLIIQKMTKYAAAAAAAAAAAEVPEMKNGGLTPEGALEAGAAGGGEGAEGAEDEEALPMIQLASFALHKLFAEWECAGHKVPQLRPHTAALPEAPELPAAPARPNPPKKAKELPAQAAGMHPCMLLTYMRPHQEYRELAVEGDRPQNMLFTMGVDVDGATYIGKAASKKEARKAAARAACAALFALRYDDAPQ